MIYVDPSSWIVTKFNLLYKNYSRGYTVHQSSIQLIKSSQEVVVMQQVGLVSTIAAFLGCIDRWGPGNILSTLPRVTSLVLWCKGQTCWTLKSTATWLHLSCLPGGRMPHMCGMGRKSESESCWGLPLAGCGCSPVMEITA